MSHDFFLVIKASLISNENIEAGEPYIFPSPDDDVSEFTGGNTQFEFPNAALKDVLDKLPESKYSQCLSNV